MARPRCFHYLPVCGPFISVCASQFVLAAYLFLRFLLAAHLTLPPLLTAHRARPASQAHKGTVAHRLFFSAASSAARRLLEHSWQAPLQNTAHILASFFLFVFLPNLASPGPKRSAGKHTETPCAGRSASAPGCDQYEGRLQNHARSSVLAVSRGFRRCGGWSSAHGAPRTALGSSHCYQPVGKCWTEACSRGEASKG